MKQHKNNKCSGASLSDGQDLLIVQWLFEKSHYKIIWLKFIILFLFFNFHSAFSTTLHVPDDYPTIQEGIDFSENGDTVLVAPGMYVENINYNGKSIVVTSSGGALSTIIDGDQEDSVVIIESGEDSTTVLSGFTIKNGYSWPGWSGSTEDYKGGGIKVYDSRPILKDLIILDNFANSPAWEFPNCGGGISCASSEGVLIQNVIVKNNETYGTFSGGGGICVFDATVEIENALIEDNIGNFFLGGGIYSEFGSNLTVRNSIIRNNSSGNGGGIYHSNGSLSLTDVIIEQNAGDSGGGGLRIGGGDIDFENVTITGNTAQYGGGLYVSCDNFNMKNSRIHSNYSNIGGGIYFSGGNNYIFDPIDRSSIYTNSASTGRDLYANESLFIEMVLDTFTVLIPDDTYATPIDNFTFDIQNLIYETIAADLYVAVDGDDNNSGLTSDDPFKTIENALTFIESDSLNPYNIYLADGVYGPSTNGEEFPIYLKSYISLIGESVNSTILDGENTTDGVILGFHQNLPALENITIRNASSNYGGGIYCINTDLNMENINIYNCSAYHGGGIRLSQSQVNAVNLEITNCSAQDRGGAIYITSDNGSIFTDGVISGNSAGNGGGIFCANQSEFYNYQITENTAVEYGGGIYIVETYDHTLLSNCIINYNNAGKYGGGMYSNHWANPILENTDFLFNSAGTSGGGIFCNYTSPEFDSENRCTIYGNTAPRGMDIFGDFTGSNVMVAFLDTFSTTLPTTDFYAKPVNKIELNILHGLEELVNSDLYVSSDGDDSNSGLTMDDPLLTIHTAYSKIFADSLNPHTIFINEGLYSSEITGELFPIYPISYTTLSGVSSNETKLDAGNHSNVILINEVDGIILKDVTIQHGNSTYGGGIYCYKSNPVLENLIIRENYAVYGGGIMLYGSDPIITLTEISNNLAINGGGVYSYYYSEPVFEHVTVVNNSGEINGGIFNNQNSYYLTISNSILWNDGDEISGSGSEETITVTYTDIENGWVGVGNIDSDPLFTDPVNGDFTLQPNSPCIDAGDPTSPLDPDGTVVDMGAYFFDQGVGCSDLLGDLNWDESVDILDVVLLVGCILEMEDNCNCGDLNGDENIDVLDVVLLVNIILEG